MRTLQPCPTCGGERRLPDPANISFQDCPDCEDGMVLVESDDNPGALKKEN
jgi:ssDNA-binding Zn-finger/Zn-ribbon topoisomerase 1